MCVLQIIRRLQQSLMIRFGVMKILKYSIMVPPPLPTPRTLPLPRPSRGHRAHRFARQRGDDVVCCLARATLHAMQPIKVIMAIHWSACFWFLVSDLSDYPDSWVRPARSLRPRAV